MPLMYSHWSFGKRFVRDETLYRKGYQALAYEIVINSNPCISYYMEENTMAMQTLVLAHAAFGHNHFFKNNYLFQQWTDAERHPGLSRLRQALCRGMRGALGAEAVESVLDAAHALMDQGVFRYPPRRQAEAARVRKRAGANASRTRSWSYSDLWRTVPGAAHARSRPRASRRPRERQQRLRLPRGEHALFPGEEQPDAGRPGSANCCASCATSRNISIRSGRPS